MTGTYSYIRAGNEIYKKSFAIIRAEADLARFPLMKKKSRCASSMPAAWWKLAKDVVFSPGMVSSARKALQAGAPILCDAKMVASGITRARLPANNEVICTLG